MQCAAVTQGKAFTGKIWKKVKGALHIPVSLAAWFIWAGWCCWAHSPLLVGTALQNKFSTVPETKLHPLTLHFPVQNRRKTGWRNSRATQIFCNLSLNMSPESLLRVSEQPRAQRTKAEEEEVTVVPSWWCQLLLCAPEHMDQPLSYTSAQEKQMQTYALKERGDTPNEKDRVSVKLCNY